MSMLAPMMMQVLQVLQVLQQVLSAAMRRCVLWPWKLNPPRTARVTDLPGCL